VGVSRRVRDAFIGWLEALDKGVERKGNSHRVRSRVAAMRNAYEFATLGCVVFAHE
jgi:hypothetical protein